MKYIIFDIDGTLTNTKDVDDKCFRNAFKSTFNIDIQNQEWGTLKNVTDWGITEELVNNSLQRPPSNSEYGLMMSSFIDNLNEEKERDDKQFSEIPGARNFFASLKNNSNYQLGIATGSWEDAAKIKLESIGIAYDQVCFSNSNYFKSREAITNDVIHQLNNKTGLDPHEIIYFGDGEWDYKTCKNLGIRFIGIDFLQDGKLSSLEAKTVFKDYLNPDEIIQRIESE